MQNIFKVMTFNVRQMDGDDGEQSWPYRKDALCEVIRQHSPAILGTQEIFKEQADYILSALPQYACFGFGRFGDDRDKHNKIFYDTARVKLENSGELWLSETPLVAGSSAWGIPRPRMITWGLLTLAGGRRIFVMNTHLPYGRNADEARWQSALLAQQQISSIDPELPIVFTGDFNASPESEIHSELTRDLEDTWVVAEVEEGRQAPYTASGNSRGHASIGSYNEASSKCSALKP